METTLSFRHNRWKDVDKCFRMIKIKGVKYKHGAYEKSIFLWDEGDVVIIERGSFNMGKRNGKRIKYYQNSKIHKKYTYVDGDKHGKFLLFFKNGSIHIKSKYWRGQLIKYQKFNKEGELIL